ncbi:hypothetical protein ACWEP4_36410 [Streptomyces sp. NPDC004227]
MSEQTTVRTPPAYAEYQALLDHCVRCTRCRRIPHQVCPRAVVLSRKWSAAKKQAREDQG